MESSLITVGKFFPFHKGHKFMIESAMSINRDGYAGSLNVIVLDGTEQDSIPVSVRKTLIEQELRTRQNNCVVEIAHPNIESRSFDENGTSTDPVFLKHWAKVLKDIAVKYKSVNPKFYSSDLYGDPISELMRVEWLPIDPSREVYNITGTKIRNNLTANFKDMTTTFQKHLRKNIAIVGPESTGKTTLTKNLAKHFNTIMVPEYGKTISEYKDNELTRDDFIKFPLAQRALYHASVKDAGRFVFWDTEDLTTYLFSKIHLGKYEESILIDHLVRSIDHYILLKPSKAFHDDGYRVLSNYEDRVEFFYNMKMLLEQREKQYTIVDSHQSEESMVGQIETILMNEFGDKI